ncbi:uncharacterized protein LOC121403078 [Xenopus laevis]|uniref:Uncharacterized protein LOC121403078 n=1 Tax=Xenopus laevis TaxID=8355 RepID=A0A8J1MXB7_XENLA|nr:uncharacterized protein LOC121403078 [Xenopus laevis]
MPLSIHSHWGLCRCCFLLRLCRSAGPKTDIVTVASSQPYAAAIITKPVNYFFLFLALSELPGPQLPVPVTFPLPSTVSLLSPLSFCLSLSSRFAGLQAWCSRRRSRHHFATQAGHYLSVQFREEHERLMIVARRVGNLNRRVTVKREGDTFLTISRGMAAADGSNCISRSVTSFSKYTGDFSMRHCGPTVMGADGGQNGEATRRKAKKLK